MKILIVDDSAFLRKILKNTIRKSGIRDLEFCEANDGLEALDILTTFSADLILSDLAMPNLDGLGFLVELRMRQNNTPFAFITAQATPAFRTQIADLNVAFILNKPFDASALHCYLQEYNPK